MKRQLLTIALACAVAASWSVQPTRAADDYLDLTSPDFQDGGTLPLKYGGNNPQNANCTGQMNRLRWRGRIRPREQEFRDHAI